MSFNANVHDITSAQLQNVCALPQNQSFLWQNITAECDVTLLDNYGFTKKQRIIIYATKPTKQVC